MPTEYHIMCVAAMLCNRYVNNLLKNDPHAKDIRRTRLPLKGRLADLVYLLNSSRSALHVADPNAVEAALSSAVHVLWKQMNRPSELLMPALDGACRGSWWRHLSSDLKRSHMHVSAKPDMPGLYPGQYGECATTRIPGGRGAEDDGDGIGLGHERMRAIVVTTFCCMAAALRCERCPLRVAPHSTLADQTAPLRVAPRSTLADQTTGHVQSVSQAEVETVACLRDAQISRQGRCEP